MRPRNQMGGGGFLNMQLTYWVTRIMIVTAVCSLVGGIAVAWADATWPSYLLLEPQALWGDNQGVLNGIPAVWQIVTYIFFEFHWIQLILVLLMYGWFAGSLETAWGSRRFLINFAIFGVGSAALTVLLALVWAPLRGFQFAGSLAVMEALIIAWALTWPNKQILAFFVLPMKGVHFIYLTLGILGLRILFGGRDAFPMFIPEIFGVLLGFAVMYRNISFKRVGLQLKKLQVQQQLKREQVQREERAKRAAELGLRVVDDEDDDDEEPPQYLH